MTFCLCICCVMNTLLQQFAYTLELTEELKGFHFFDFTPSGTFETLLIGMPSGTHGAPWEALEPFHQVHHLKHLEPCTRHATSLIVTNLLRTFYDVNGKSSFSRIRRCNSSNNIFRSFKIPLSSPLFSRALLDRYGNTSSTGP